jgi:hypothetical protein
MIAHRCHAPLQAGHPVRRSLSVKRKRLWNTGCPVEPGNDKKKLEPSGLCELDFNPQLNFGQHRVETWIAGGGLQIGRSIA